MKKFWNVIRNGTKEGEIRLYGDIGDPSWWNPNSVGAREFNDELDEIRDVEVLTIRINSSGGEVFAGIAIHNSIKNHGATVKKVYVDGIAASIASIIAMAGTEIIMPVNAWLMIHNPSSGVIGTAEEMRKRADTLDKLRDSLIDTYMERSNLSKEEIIQMLDNETWLSADEALEKGFITKIDKEEIGGEIENRMLMINGVGYDINRYSKFPVTSFLNLNTKNKEEETNKMGANNNQNEPQKTEITADIIKNSYSDIYNSIRNEAIAEERTRMLAIDEIAGTTENQELIINAKKDGKTKAELALDILNYQKQLGQTEIEKMVKDSAEINEIKPETAPEGQTETIEANATGIATIINKMRGVE